LPVILLYNTFAKLRVLKATFMEFTCVLSVGGSLAHYNITKHSDTVFVATLKDGPAKRDDLPVIIRLDKGDGIWVAEPWHDQIVTGLTHAIETAL
jgi:hypothetical protein